MMNPKYPVGTLVYNSSNGLGIVLGMVLGFKDKEPNRYVIHWFKLEWSSDYSQQMVEICVHGYKSVTEGRML